MRIGETELALEDPLVLALAELEASADEPMRSDELVEPPAAVDAGFAPPAGAERPGAAPIAELPKRTSAPPTRRRGGLRSFDVAVALLALAVLALSLLGLAWVLRAE